MPTATAALPQWMARLRREGEYFLISEPRRYSLDEASYDQYHQINPAHLMVGQGVVGVAREEGGSFDGLALEVGCGTGQVSVGLAQADAYPLTILTDPSPEFLKITQKKIQAQGFSEDRVAYAVLMGEEIDRLPPNEFSLIVLRSALHHVLDVEAFIAAAGRALRPGGILTFQEPCMEGFILMGTIAQLMPGAAAATGRPLTEAQLAKVRTFAGAMSYYTRRDVDKAKAEDKHVFRVDELMTSCARAGMSMRFFPNRTYDQWSRPPEARGQPPKFTAFFRSHLQHCASWDEAMLARFDECLAPLSKYVDDLSGGGSGPYMHGVFAARKLNG